MAQQQQPAKRGQQSADEQANQMDWPVPGSEDTPRPEPVATGFTEPIEAAEQASETGAQAESTGPRTPGPSSKP